MRAIRLVAGLGLVLCTGCAGLGRYAKDRGNDFLDCFTLEAGLGSCADVDVHVTDLIATGAGFATSGKCGLRGREPLDSFAHSADDHLGLPFLPPGLLTCYRSSHQRPVAHESDLDVLMARGPWLLRALITDCSERNFTPQTLICDNYQPGRTTASILFLNVLPFVVAKEQRNPKTKLIDAFDVDVGATVIPLSARVGFRLGHFPDFLLGLFGLDIAGDDAPTEAPKTTKGGVPCER